MTKETIQEVIKFLVTRITAFEDNKQAKNKHIYYECDNLQFDCHDPQVEFLYTENGRCSLDILVSLDLEATLNETKKLRDEFKDTKQAKEKEFRYNQYLKLKEEFEGTK